MNSAPVSDPAGRPACSAKTRARARLRAKDPGLTMYGIQTSPNRPARRIAGVWRPPTQIGGCGRCTGGGSSRRSRSEPNGPSAETRSPDSSRTMTSSASSVREPRPTTGAPTAANSGGYSPPTPMPRSKRPLEIRSSVEAIFAASAIGYSGKMVSALSSRTRSVTPAAVARVRNALDVGP